MTGVNQSPGRSVCIVVSGCPESRLDAAALERRLVEAMGFVANPDYRQADQIVYFGCSDYQDAEDSSIRIIRLLRERKRPDAGLIVTGCLSRIRPDVSTVQTPYPELVPAVNEILAFGPESWRWATHQYRPTHPVQAGLLQEASLPVPSDTNRSESAGPGKPPVSRLARKLVLSPWRKWTASVEKRAFRFWRDPDVYGIKISTGCCNCCAFCSIRHSRGGVRSKPVDVVLREFEAGLKGGHQKFVLLGTNTGAYGVDVGSGLADLLERMVSREGRFSIALRNVEPNYVTDAAPRLADLARTGHLSLLHSAIQTGSDRLLKLMRRNTRSEDFIRAVELILGAWPKMSIMTQIMVGFPGETEADFAATLDLLERVPFDYIECFGYTDRPNTPAAGMTDRPDEETIARRMRQVKLRNFTHRPINALKKRRRFGRGHST